MTQQAVVSKSWVIALIIALVFLALGCGVRFEIEAIGDPGKRSWLNLTLFLCGYVLVLCLQPIQKAILRKLCQRAAQHTRQKIAR